MCCFCCLTGLSYSDVKSLSSNDVSKGIDGKMWIRKHRKKTEVYLELLFLILLSLLKDIKTMANAKGILPVISNQRMNLY